MRQKWLWLGTALFFAFTLYFIWYLETYAMDRKFPYSVNSKELSCQVLLATQGSEYKDAIESKMAEYARRKNIYLEVIDVHHLNTVIIHDWTAVVIMHTWEMWEPQRDARAFIEKNNYSEKLLVHSTSGSAEERFQYVDAMSGASNISAVDTVAQYLQNRIDELLFKKWNEYEYCKGSTTTIPPGTS